MFQTMTEEVGVKQEIIFLPIKQEVKDEFLLEEDCPQETGSCVLPTCCDVDKLLVNPECKTEVKEEITVDEDLFLRTGEAVTRGDGMQCRTDEDNTSSSYMEHCSEVLQDSGCTLKTEELQIASLLRPDVASKDNGNLAGFIIDSVGSPERNVISIEDFTSTDRKSFSCPICSAKFSTRHTLQSHLRTHTGNKPFSCPTCSAKFRHKSTLQTHSLTHTGDKPFSCATCSAKFSRRHTLLSHLLTHTGDKPYSCPTCSAKFRHRTTLQNHLLTHTGAKPFSCPTCSAKFRHKSTLQSHLLTHTGDKPYSCPTRIVDLT